MSERPRILLDCDPGHDDAMAIVAAARYADLVGITTVAGNAPLERTTHNARVMRDLLGIDVAVHAGSPRPLVAEPKFAAFVHGESGLDGADLRTAVDAPRLHTDHGHLDVEHHDDPEVLQALGKAFADHRVWPSPNMFFGGVHAARRTADGRLVGVGDARRDGTSITVT